MILAPDSLGNARYGSPSRTRRLGDEPNLPVVETLTFRPGLVDKAGIGHVLRDWVSSALEVDQKFVLAHQYGFLVNVLLRQMSEAEKVRAFSDLISGTEAYLKWEDRQGNAGITTAHPFLPSLTAKITLPRGCVDPSVSMHEAIHFMQHKRWMPHNNLLTFLVGELVEIESGKSGIVRQEGALNGGLLYPYYLKHPDAYFRMILNGSVIDAYAGWVHNLSDSQRNFLENEQAIIREMASYDEPRIPTLHGASNIYSQVMNNFGRHRAERAAAVGLLSGNVDHAWTIVWLYSLGKANFDEAEREVVGSILQRNVDRYYKYPVVDFSFKVAKEG